MTFELLIIVALILANGVFAGAEIAIVSVRKTRMVELAEHGSADARAVLLLKDNSERFLATVQIGITLVSATAAAFGGASIAQDLTPALAEIPWIGEQAKTVAVSGVVAVVSYLSIVLGELVPKSLALNAAERYALWVARPLLGLSWLARPVVWLLTASANTVLRPLGDRTNFTEARYSTEELQELVRGAASAATIHPKVGDIADRALELAELTAADLMIPRQDVVMLSLDMSDADLRAILETMRFTRFPVYSGSHENVVGYVAVKDMLTQLLAEGKLELGRIMRQPRFLPEHQRAVQLLETMRDTQPMAIVVDETGGMAGIVTLEDVLETFVGEIQSEHSRLLPEEILIQGPGLAKVLGTAPVRAVNRALSLELPEDGSFSTIAGYCLALAGKIPSVGEKLVNPEGIEFEIVEATPRRIQALLVRVPTELHRASSTES